MVEITIHIKIKTLIKTAPSAVHHNRGNGSVGAQIFHEPKVLAAAALLWVNQEHHVAASCAGTSASCSLQ